MRISRAMKVDELVNKTFCVKGRQGRIKATQLPMRHHESQGGVRTDFSIGCSKLCI